MKNVSLLVCYIESKDFHTKMHHPSQCNGWSLSPTPSPVLILINTQLSFTENFKHRQGWGLHIGVHNKIHLFADKYVHLFPISLQSSFSYVILVSDEKLSNIWAPFNDKRRVSDWAWGNSLRSPGQGTAIQITFKVGTVWSTNIRIVS